MADAIELYLIRHGVAAERGDEWPDDSKRPLTARGISRMRKEGAALDRIGITFDEILTSPMVRARQTATALAEGFSAKPPIATFDPLSVGGKIPDVIDGLAKHSRSRRIALVGHEPGIGELAARLLGVRTRLEFKKGAVCRIDVDTLPPATPGRLRWFAAPRMLRLIAR